MACPRRQVGVLPKEAREKQLIDFIDGNLARLFKDIKYVKLYDKPTLVVYLYNELRAAGLDQGPLSYKDLEPYDQIHYHLSDSLEDCVRLLKPLLAAAGEEMELGGDMGLEQVIKNIFPTKGTETLGRWLSECSKLDLETMADVRMITESIWAQLDLSPLLKSGLSHARGPTPSIQGPRTINIGSCLGGCARYFAGKHKWNVLAVELQESLHGTSVELTARCEAEVQARVSHMGGDFEIISKHLVSNNYHAILSWLTVLHIKDRPALFRNCFELLRPGGVFYADDFYQKGSFGKAESSFMTNEVYVRSCTSMEEYRRDLEEAGFEIRLMHDLQEPWMQWTRERYEVFCEQREEKVAKHGKNVVERLDFFYSGIANLFASGNLGGVRVVAVKPYTRPEQSKG